MNFGYNRTFALNAAKDMADDVLLLDADMCLEIQPSFDKQKLTAAAYTVEQGSSSFSYHNVRLIRTSGHPECVGATHEFYHVGPGETHAWTRCASWTLAW